MSPRVPPHSGACPTCDELIIDAAIAPASRIVLDAEIDPQGPYRAFYSAGVGWVAGPWAASEHFLGMRRREHACHLREKQLELGAEEPA